MGANVCALCRLGVSGKCPGVQTITDTNGFLSSAGVDVSRKENKYCVGMGDFIKIICTKNQITGEEAKKLHQKQRKQM